MACVSKIIVTSKRNYTLDNLPNMKVGNANLPSSHSEKNTGIIFDTGMNMDAHINATCKRAFCEIRTIDRIRPLMNDKEAASQVHAFISWTTANWITLFLYYLGYPRNSMTNYNEY